MQYEESIDYATTHPPREWRDLVPILIQRLKWLIRKYEIEIARADIRDK